MFSDSELEIIEVAVEYWNQVVATDLSNVEKRHIESILEKVDRQLNP